MATPFLQTKQRSWVSVKTMKRLFTIIAAVLITAHLFAQAPESMSYQAVVRDNNDNLIANTAVGHADKHSARQYNRHGYATHLLGSGVDLRYTHRSCRATPGQRRR